jgi:hypothetical protein
MQPVVTARHVAIALAGIVAGVMLTGAAHAIVETSFTYSTPQTGYLMVSAPAFTPQTDTVAYSNGNALHGITNSCFYAPVQLPQGAKMTQLAMWYLKNDTTATEIQLQRYSPATPADLTVVATLPFTNSNGVIKKSSANITDTSVQGVNNLKFIYRIIACMSGHESLVTARITYTYTSAGD